jgi:hypothetical protein
MIVKGELATPRAVARFRAEAEAAANLDHPRIGWHGTRGTGRQHRH